MNYNNCLLLVRTIVSKYAKVCGCLIKEDKTFEELKIKEDDYEKIYKELFRLLNIKEENIDNIKKFNTIRSLAEYFYFLKNDNMS